jgi:hypothetical protein
MSGVECWCIWPCATTPEAVAAAKASMVEAKDNPVLAMMIAAALHGPHRWYSAADLQQAVRG